jgi:hypothetical protein
MRWGAIVDSLRTSVNATLRSSLHGNALLTGFLQFVPLEMAFDPEFMHLAPSIYFSVTNYQHA